MKQSARPKVMLLQSSLPDGRRNATPRLHRTLLRRDADCVRTRARPHSQRCRAELSSHHAVGSRAPQTVHRESTALQVDSMPRARGDAMSLRGRSTLAESIAYITSASVGAFVNAPRLSYPPRVTNRAEIPLSSGLPSGRSLRSLPIESTLRCPTPVEQPPLSCSPPPSPPARPPSFKCPRVTSPRAHICGSVRRCCPTSTSS